MNKTEAQIVPEHCDVAVVGGGPSGLSTATELKKFGVSSVVVLEREAQAGGIPRHCGHSPFGMREFKRVYSGAIYARKLTNQAKQAGVNLCLSTSVISIRADGTLQLSTPEGSQILRAKKVVLCTGIRETPRAARLIAGQRPMGIMTTGALQSIIYLQNGKPFKRPLIVGSELVSFSALLSCRHAGIRPIAMLTSNARITAISGMQLLAKTLAVPIHYNTRLTNILGKRTVSGVQIENENGEIKNLRCDGVIFTGQFIAESSLMRMSHLAVDANTGNPIIDQFGRCSDPNFFATGNMTHPIETAGYCWQDGKQTAHHVYAGLSGELDHYDQKSAIVAGHPKIKYIVPQMLACSSAGEFQHGRQAFQLRFEQAAKGRISLHAGKHTLIQKTVNTLPERRVSLAIPKLANEMAGQALQLHFTDD